MNNVIKGVGLFLLGVGTGSVTTYFFMKKNNKIEYEIVKPATPAAKIEEPEQETEEEEVVEEKGWSVVNMADKIEPRFTDYSAMSKEVSTDDELPKIMERIVPQPTDEEMEMIHEITEQEFVDGHLEARTFSVWMFDEQLYDEDNDTIEIDVTNTISEWLLDKFINDDEKETIYIRNENTGTDYEVFKRGQSYREYTMNRE